MKEKKIQAESKDAKVDSKAAVYTMVLIIAAFAVIIFSLFILPGVRFIGAREAEGRMGVAPPEFTDLNSYLTLRLALSAFNMLLVVYLLFVYVRNYLVLKANFTLGIIAFLFSFLLYALSSLPLVHGVFGPFGIGGIFSFVPMLFSAIGLIIFAKLGDE